METTLKSILLAIEGNELTEKDLSILVQFIADDLRLMTISDTAKYRGKSFNGIKNFNDKVLIGNKKFIINRNYEK